MLVLGEDDVSNECDSVEEVWRRRNDEEEETGGSGFVKTFYKFEH